MRHRILAIAGTAVLGLLAPIVAPHAATAEPAPAIDADAPPKGDPDPEVVASSTGSYIVVMADDPLIASIDPADLGSAAAEAQAAELESDHDQVLAEAGVSTGEKIQDYTNALNGFAATLSHAQAVKVASHPGVATVLPDEMRQITTDSSADFLGLTGRGRAYASGLTGEGVVVGVIDTGIWPEHPSFADDGSYAAPPVALDNTARPSCEFGNTAHHPDDAPFTCNNKLIGARQMLDTYRAVIGAESHEFDSARDDNGHGTHTAGTAAGNADVDASIFGKDYGTISGIAPRAHVVAYKGLGELGGFTSDLTAAIDQAVADGVDVINYSVGGGPGINSPDAIAYLFAADAGVWVATSAGNSGPGEATIGGPADVPWITTVGASTQRRFLAGTVVLRDKRAPGSPWWHNRNVQRYKGASVTPPLPSNADMVDAEFHGGDLCMRGTLDEAAVAGKVVLCRRGAIGRAEKSLAVHEAGGVGMVLYNNTDSDNLFTDNHWVPSVHVDYTEGLEIKQYLADHANPAAKIVKTGKSTKINYAPSMAYFSSRGENPSSADVIKPDITAPGVQILAAGSPFVDPDSNPPGELFQAISGTSMSSPHVAGFYALLRQAHPDWTAAMAKSAVMTSANVYVNDSDRDTMADPFDMGAGHLDPGKVNKRGSTFNPGLVYDAGLFEYAAFTCGADLGIFTPGSCTFLEGLGIPTDPSDLNLASIGIGELAGSQTVVRTVTSVGDRHTQYWAEIDAPDGYDVTVNPSSFHIAPGETVTYEVTISNNGGGPVGEWRFGSMGWKSNHGWHTGSPIAVRGTMIGTPEAVAGVGADGAASFDVDFGYSGDYTAAPHGLSPEVVVSGSVSQDPDQTYTPGETSPGVVLVPWTLTDAAFARIELVIPGPDDIDLFLEDSSGNIVAQSTSGGTDEHIDLLLPANDNYTLVVHGWAVPSEPLDFDISTWVVPLASGGSLSVDSAPASAVVGTSGTIDVSWSAVPTGRHLGAVSHSNAGGLLGLTLVEVDVPPAP